jgi:hypothetical protein
MARRWPTVIALVILFACVAVLLGGCRPPHSGYVYQQGRETRSVVDRMIRDAGDFLAGFCAPPALVLPLAGLAWARRRRKS